MKKVLIELKEAVALNPVWRLSSPINFSLCEGENILVVGRNGAGKTMLINTILGNYPLREGSRDYFFDGYTSNHMYDNVKYLAFNDNGSVSDYYQQRWNSFDQEDAVMVDSVLADYGDKEYLAQLLKVLNIEHVVGKKLLSLSNGELRKLQIIKTLISKPAVLIIDNPYIGLDITSRVSLENLFSALSKNLKTSLIIVQSRLYSIPDFITHIVSVKDMCCLPKVTVQEYLRRNIPENFEDKETLEQKVMAIPSGTDENGSDEIVNLNNVTVRYGDEVLIRDVSWNVRKGQKWALLGDNGSGKSTLLSLICADNPQGYACDMRLFGRKRGSGESIWEIKKRIGYVSPEMYRSYLLDYTVLEVVASGLSDFIGLFKEPDQSQIDRCMMWLDLFGIKDLADKSFLRISSGEQRIALLTRAFVKDPELLILDEPLHGLDSINCQIVRTIIEAFCNRPNKTLIMVTHYPKELPSSITNTLILKYKG
ncbi:MAG: ATP-binding cassette domain-containing protein [Bacteroidales bacterium]|nr:ATP-binding cassette domain-containing protein [Bacteroidales bacterium]